MTTNLTLKTELAMFFINSRPQLCLIVAKTNYYDYICTMICLHKSRIMLAGLAAFAAVALALLWSAATPNGIPETSGSSELSDTVLVSLIETWPGTKKAKLPKMEERSKIRREMSSAPGRIFMARHLIIDKPAVQGRLVNALGDVLMVVPICASKNRGQKYKADDCCTPEGTFPLYGVYNSTDWTYEDTDDKCYGPWFLSLKTPRYWGVGVHGTNNPGSVPGRRSHGCIRMHNDNIIKVKSLIQKDSRVTVMPDPISSSTE